MKIIYEIVVQRSAARCIEEGGLIAQPIWSVSLNEIVGCSDRVQKEVDENENVKSQLKMFPKHDMRYLFTRWKRHYRIKLLDSF